MLKVRIVNLLLITTIFLFVIVWIRIFLTFWQEKNYALAEPEGSCMYLKWDALPSNEGIVPQSTLNPNNEVTASPIRVNAGRVIIQNITNQDPIFRAIGTSSLDVVSSSRICLGGVCRSNWPSGGGSDYWLLFNSGGRSYLRPSSTNWWVSIGSTTPPTTTLQVFGNVMADQFLGSISAINVSAGTFGSSTGGGNFTFPANLVVRGTSTANILMATSMLLVGTEQGVSQEIDTRPSARIVGTLQASKICLGSACRTSFDKDKYYITVRFPFFNGILYPPTTSWSSVFPVEMDAFRRDNLFRYPYINFIEITERFSNLNSTSTPWFDIAYGHHHINEPGYDKALYVEASDNSRPLVVYHLPIQLTNESDKCGASRLKRNDCSDIFLGGTFYDSSDILRSTSSEKFFVEKCFNTNMNDGCKAPGPSQGNFLDRSVNVSGRVLLELRVVGWQKPKSDYRCLNKEYIPRMRLQSWNHPNDVFFRINKFRYVTSSINEPCDTAWLRSKLQGRFVVDDLRYLTSTIDGQEVQTSIRASTIGEIVDYLKSQRENFYFAFKEAGIVLGVEVQNP